MVLELLPRQRLRIDAIVQDGARAGFEQKHQRTADRGLARPGFADDAKGLAAADVETDAIDGFHGGAAIAGLEPDLEIAHRDNGVVLRLLPDIGGLRRHGWPTIAAIGPEPRCCNAPGTSRSRKRPQRTFRPPP